MLDFAVGDELYFWNKLTNYVDSIVVTAVSSDGIGFQYRYRDKLYKMTYEKARGKLFHQPPFWEEPLPPDSCDNCQLRRSGDCTSIGNKLCPDYQSVPFVSKYEREHWPKPPNAWWT